MPYQTSTHPEASPQTSYKAKAPLERLKRFVGEWRGQGLVFDAMGGTGKNVMARDTFEWLDGDYFLIHRWRWIFAETIFQGLELLGWNHEKNEFFSTMYDNAGHHESYHLSEKNGIWSYKGKSQQATIILSSDGQRMSSKWKSSTNGHLSHELSDMKWNKLS